MLTRGHREPSTRSAGERRACNDEPVSAFSSCEVSRTTLIKRHVDQASTCWSTERMEPGNWTLDVLLLDLSLLPGEAFVHRNANRTILCS